MRRLVAIVFAVGLLAHYSQASELRVAIVQGANIRTFTGSPGGKYSVQCPNIDGGSGQKVWYRPGCNTRPDAGVQCVVDAGLGDVIMDFTDSTGVKDPYKIDLAPNEDRIHFANADSYATAVYCTIFRRSP